MDHCDAELDALFRSYRAACPEVEAGPDFMPTLWQKIEARQNFWSVFGHLGKTMTTASAALFLLLLVLNLLTSPGVRYVAPTYADALMADHTAEQTDYAEAIRTPVPDTPPGK